MRLLTCALLALLLTLPTRAWAADDSKSEKPADSAKQVYDEKADAKALIHSALQSAERENRRVLIQWGGNWCPWCQALHQRLSTNPQLARALLYEYDVVHVDSRSNVELAKEFDVDLKKQGVPFLTILDASGKVLVNQSTERFETKKDDKKGHDPEKLKEFLTKYQAKPRVAEEALSAALAEARKSDRKVFVHFGAPWCGWCHQLDAWLARPEVAKLFGSDYVELKIDVDRMTGGKDVMTRYNAEAKGGIPWFAILDANGKTIVTSDGPKGNIGFPAQKDEIAHFVTMLEKTKKRLNENDVDGLRKSLDQIERNRQAKSPPASKGTGR